MRKKCAEDEKANEERDAMVQAKREHREKSKAKWKELREKIFKKTRSGQPRSDWLVPRRPWGRSGQRRPACPSQISSSRTGSWRAVESSCRRGESVGREGGAYREEWLEGEFNRQPGGRRGGAHVRDHEGLGPNLGLRGWRRLVSYSQSRPLGLGLRSQMGDN
jgi:hypothetical protein